MILTLLALLLLSFVTRAAARLASANARLSKEIEARTAAEEAMRQSQKLEALGQLTGGIAHDFNNLLQAIHGAFELILGKSKDEKTVRRWAQNGLEAADRGASLTRQLLAFSRQQKLEMKPLIVAETLERMGDLLTRTIGPEVQLVFDLDNDRACDGRRHSAGAGGDEPGGQRPRRHARRPAHVRTRRDLAEWRAVHRRASTLSCR